MSAFVGPCFFFLNPAVGELSARRRPAQKTYGFLRFSCRPASARVPGHEPWHSSHVGPESARFSACGQKLTFLCAPQAAWLKGENEAFLAAAYIRAMDASPPSAAQPAQPEAAEAPKPLLCQICKLEMPADAAGRHKVKTFTCRCCLSLQTTLYRNVGQTPVQGMSLEDRATFFQKCKEAPLAGRYTWQTVRSNLLSRLVSQHITEQEHAVEAERLPLSVWLARGWERPAVESCPFEDHDKLGRLYAVPIRKDVFRELHRKAEEKICELEKALREKKNQKRKSAALDSGLDQDDGPAVELDVAVESLATGRPAKEAKTGDKPEAVAKRTQKAVEAEKAKADKKNQVKVDLAAKALSIVTPFCKAVPTVLKQLPCVEKDGTAEADVSEDEAEALRRAESEASAWQKACAELLALREATRGAGVPLADLPFVLADLKVRKAAWGELLKSARRRIKEQRRNKEQAPSSPPAPKGRARRARAARK